ncbi:hypothetical protein ACLOJK_028050 [Asimina triloba]
MPQGKGNTGSRERPLFVILQTTPLTSFSVDLAKALNSSAAALAASIRLFGRNDRYQISSKRPGASSEFLNFHVFSDKQPRILKPSAQSDDFAEIPNPEPTQRCRRQPERCRLLTAVEKQLRHSSELEENPLLLPVPRSSAAWIGLRRCDGGNRRSMAAYSFISASSRRSCWLFLALLRMEGKKLSFLQNKKKGQ